MQNLWDKKASNYQRFDGKISAIQQQIFSKALAWGVDLVTKISLISAVARAFGAYFYQKRLSI